MISDSLRTIDKSFETLNKFKWIKIFTDLERGKWVIILFTLLSVMMAFSFIFGQKQKYTVSALIHSKNKNDLIELIISDAVLTDVINDQSLKIVTTPLEVRIISQLYKMFFSKTNLDKSNITNINFLKKFNWNKNEILITELKVPEKSENKNHRLIITSMKNYSVPTLKVNGEIGELVKSENNLTKIIIDKVNAPLNSEFDIEKQSLPKALGKLRKEITITHNDKTNFVHVTMTGTEKTKLLAKLNSLLHVLSIQPPDSMLIRELLKDVEIIDWAKIDIPSKTITNKARILQLGLLFGLLSGSSIVLLSSAVRRRTSITDPEKLENLFDIPVYATIPQSKLVRLTSGLGLTKNSKRQKTLLALEEPNDYAIESLRSLRTSMHFALLESKNNVVAITGPSPAVGKSFIASNLSAVLALGNEKRVLLIDADMRMGYLHNILNQSVSPGLKELLDGSSSLEEVIRCIDIKNVDISLDIITRGMIPSNPSELLMHSNFEKVISKLSGLYDLVIIDTPPIHAVTDAAIICRSSGLVFMVVRSGQNSAKEIEHAISHLLKIGIETKGFIFNGFMVKHTSSLYVNRYTYGEYK